MGISWRVVRAGEVVLAAVLTVAAAYLLQTTLRCVSLGYESVLYWDQWGKPTLDVMLEDVFAQHNEHRIAVPRLIFALDWWAGGRQLVSIAAIFLFHLAHAALLTALAWKHLPPRFAPRLACFAWTLCCLFSLAQWENFVWGFQVQMTMVFALSTAAFAALALGGETVGSLVLALVLASMATFSMANGLAAAPLLLLLACAVKRPRWQIAVIAAVAVSLVAFYMRGYRGSAVSTDPLASLRDPRPLLTYFLVYLGAPLTALTRASGHQGALAAGGVVFSVCATLSLVSLWRYRQLSPQHWVLLFVAWFLLATASMTAVGRVSGGLETAFALRYATCALLFWATVGLLVAIELRRVQLPVGVHLGVAMAAIACVVSLVQRQKQDTDNALHMAGLKRLAATVLLADARDEQFAMFVCMSAPEVFEKAAKLRRAKRSLFSEPWADWLGDSITKHAQITDSTECAGALEEVTPIATSEGTAYRVQGWTHLTATRDRPLHVVLVDDASQVVVGYAKTGNLREELRQNGRSKNIRAGFRGHIGSRLPNGGRVVAYALLSDDSRACRLAGVMHVPAAPRLIEDMSRSQPVASMAVPDLSGSFRAGGVPAAEAPAELPQTFGSHGGGEGTLLWRGTVPEDAAALAVPLWVGRQYDWSTPGLVRVIGDDGVVWGELIASIGFDRWRYWSVRRPQAAGPGFRIEVQEHGLLPEQWVGVRTPRAVPYRSAQ